MIHEEVAQLRKIQQGKCTGKHILPALVLNLDLRAFRAKLNLNFDSPTSDHDVPSTSFLALVSLLKDDQNGVYAFDLVVERKLTMSSHKTDQWHHGTPVDYSAGLGGWSKREPDQLKGCFDNYTLQPHANSVDAAMLDDVVVLDGKHKRVLTVNGKTPGDTIVVPYLAEVLLRVHNKVLMDAITIHVHGIDKHDLWYMDGVAFIQQCPIQSTNYFEYRFIADNKGTHWYHGHFQTDRGDGLLGGFVVVDTNDTAVPVDSKGKREVPDREYFVMLQNWG
ncbi:multicopper oxidase [Ancylostoma duodenale]|uniref:Multicopper oxidase n=1 Tax=Ancylostoma duodenale TaxID=51022 RepID=A0A0C2H505_9BILA|nr:multicopper oxidase [Ancylostoma duodenale]